MLQQFNEKNRELVVNVNGRLLHRNEAGVSPFDSAVQGGDAVWEGLRLYDGRIFALEEHLARLRSSALALAFVEIPPNEKIVEEIRRTLEGVIGVPATEGNLVDVLVRLVQLDKTKGKFYEVVKHVTEVRGAYSAHPIMMDLGRYQKLPQYAKDALGKVGADLAREMYALDVEWVNIATAAMKGKVTSYAPTAAEMAQWHKGAKDAWTAVRGTYDPKLALRILEEQGQKGLIADLKAAKAL